MTVPRRRGGRRPPPAKASTQPGVEARPTVGRRAAGGSVGQLSRYIWIIKSNYRYYIDNRFIGIKV